MHAPRFHHHVTLGEIWLAPLGGEPEPPVEWFTSDRMIAVLQGPTVVIRCRVREGRSWISVNLLAAEPGGLAEHVAAGGWEVGEDEDIDIETPLHLGSPGDEWQRDVVVPMRPGLHRVRVLAKGHVLNDPFEQVDCDEEFEVHVWPTEHPSPRARAMDEERPWRRRPGYWSQ